MALRDTRALLGAVLSGQMDDVVFRRCECFGWDVPTSAPQVDAALLDPRSTWSDPVAYDRQADDLVARFNRNFEPFASGVSHAVLAAAPGVREAVS